MKIYNVIYYSLTGTTIHKAEIRIGRTNKVAIQKAIELGETTLFVTDEYTRTPINLCGLLANALQKLNAKVAKP